MTRRMAFIIALIYTIFGFGFWTVYNLRMDLAGEKSNAPVHDFATVNFDEDHMGRAEFTEQGSAGFVEIQVPDGWIESENIEIDGSVAFEKNNVVVVFSGYSVPQPKDKTTELVDELMMMSVQAEKKDTLSTGSEWCEYARQDDSSFKTGSEYYYINVHGDKDISYVTIVDSYVPNKMAGSDIVEDLLERCTIDVA